MKKLTVLFPVIALLLVACNGGKEKNKSGATTENVPIVRTEGLKIAYYIQDSLKTGYKYYAELDSTVKVKQLAFQKELQKRESALRSYIAANEEKANSGLLSAFDIQKVQEEAQKRQQAYLQYQESEGMKLDQETTQHLEVLSNRINDAAKKFSKENGIDILMMHGMGSGLTYITEEMNVTQAFIEYLNKYQAELDKSIGK